MPPRKGLRLVIAALLVLLLLLLVAFFVLVALGSLLGAMGDELGQAVMGRVALAAGVVLLIDLLLLVVVQAVRLLDEPDEPPP